MKILLTTLNARYAHTSLGLRYLYANLGEHQKNAVICEYTLDQRPIDIVEQLLAQEPDVISLGVYIWNIHQSEAIAKMIKAVRPDIILIIGGPEVSYEHHLNAIVDVVDYVICGWGEASLPKLLSDIENQRRPVNKIIQGIKLPLDDIKFPYDYYTDTDLAQRILYVEASRGCPFTCEFCISSLDESVQAFNIDAFLAEMEKLFQRGARTFKFVDRTFNIKLENSKRILQFFLDKIAKYPEEGIFAHFEVVPDYLPEELRRLIQAFPKGALQLEIGIQTLNRDVQRNISRRTHLGKAKESISWLSTQTGAHLHVDLIAGLPGENLASFAKGFNELWSWQPQEIQLGILKRLKGTPIVRHTDSFEFVYDELAPFAALKNRDLSFVELQHINRLSRFWDLIINSGRFPHTTPLILGETPFENMWELSDWIFKTTKQTHKIALDRLIKLIFDWLTSKNLPKQEIISLLSADFMTMGIQGWPHYLGSPPEGWRAKVNNKGSKGTVRQDRHMVGN
ncbi:B12-binding domain-containing radical SAM protein [Zophobihabitans entericus]|uniref:DUF4080 domain-containing protein n=1 Tax=Zophobihabitans entericus TaxID=1635327 RepID=A0A6G9IEI7_9GAMM|nr:radical SAM protein [Zophobihabitans entericus]QIQ22000.1 DUF4080 domain-containing protein [Zophobihabitans entericus]